jgi:hypothetical protein
VLVLVIDSEVFSTKHPALLHVSFSDGDRLQGHSQNARTTTDEYDFGEDALGRPVYLFTIAIASPRCLENLLDGGHLVFFGQDRNPPAEGGQVTVLCR